MLDFNIEFFYNFYIAGYGSQVRKSNRRSEVQSEVHPGGKCPWTVEISLYTKTR